MRACSEGGQDEINGLTSEAELFVVDEQPTPGRDESGVLPVAQHTSDVIRQPGPYFNPPIF
jgi:hypothetical protein